MCKKAALLLVSRVLFLEWRHICLARKTRPGASTGASLSCHIKHSTQASIRKLVATALVEAQ